LRDLLRPLCVTVCHNVGEEAQQRWLVRACLAAGDVAASFDPLWANWTTCPSWRLPGAPAVPADAGACGGAG